MSDLQNGRHFSLQKGLPVGMVLFVVAVLTAWLGIKTQGIFYSYSSKITKRGQPSASGPPVSRKVVVVVVDGLSLGASRRMPALMKLRQKGAFLIAQTETPSYSRVGYSAIATGAGSSVTAVTANARDSIVPLDSIFRQARLQGYNTAFVGYAWWMELFGKDIGWASIDSAWGATHRMFRWGPILPSLKLQSDIQRRILEKGSYTTIKEDWDSYIQHNHVLDHFGDDPKTRVHEDDVRTKEAIRIIQREQRGSWFEIKEPVDLLFVHLESPDQKGHDSGSPYSLAYRDACEVVDRNIKKIADALDLSTDTLIVTADHGFTKTLKGAGHGGWEHSSSLVPLMMVGAGIKKGWMTQKWAVQPMKGSRQLIRQIDISPTISVLLGLPFTFWNEGRPIWQAMALPGGIRGLRNKHWKETQVSFFQDYAKAHGWRLFPDGKRRKGAGNWWFVRQAFAKAKVKHTRELFWKRFGVGLVFLLLFAWGMLRKESLWRFPWGSALLCWGLFELLFLGLYVGLLGVYSLSAVAGGTKGGLTILGLSALSFVLICLGAWLVMFIWRIDSRLFRLERMIRLWLILMLSKSVLGFGVIGTGSVLFMPDGLILFGVLVFQLQAAASFFCGAGLLACLAVWLERDSRPFKAQVFA